MQDREARRDLSDSSGTAWLVRTVDVKTVSRKRAPSPTESRRNVPRLMSPEPTKGRRGRLALEGSFEDSADAVDIESATEIADRALRSVDSRRSQRRGASRGVDRPLSRAFSPPTKRLLASPISKKRPKRRRKTQAASSKSTPALPLVSPSASRSKKKKKKLIGRKQKARKFGSSADDDDFSSSLPRDFRFRGDFRPGSSSQVQRSLDRHSPTDLGSSQHGGCPGDFCELSIEVDTGEDKVDDLTLEVMRDMGRLPLDGEGMNADDTDASGNAVPMYVTYKAIAQARAEKPLVQLLVRRLESGTKGEYFNTIEEPESAFLGKSFPSHYYRQVKVCSRCYKMYSKIEKARQRAIAKIDPSLGRSMGNIDRPSREHSRRMNKRGVGIGSSQASENQQGQKRVQQEQQHDSQKVQALKRAKDAINTLTKGDIAEFRSFSSPPDQVIMVSEALMILLTGEALPWEAAKRVMANGERFINMLLDFDGADIPKTRIRALMSFVEDENFRPYVLEPVSKSAAAFCSWVLGTVQANRYKTGAAHPRLDPLLRP